MCLDQQISHNVEAYIDDVVIKSKTANNLITDLEETFANLKRYRWKLNPLKCIFGVPSGILLGYIISARGIEPNPDKGLHHHQHETANMHQGYTETYRLYGCFKLLHITPR